MRALALSLSLLFAVISVPGAGIAAVPPEPIHPERMKMLPEDRRDRVLADLEAILSGPASPASITTTPYRSFRDGLCRRDVIILRYDREKESDRNSPFEPVGIRQVLTQYHLLGDGKTRSVDQWQKACKGLTDPQLYWAWSKDDSSASRALTSLYIAVSDVRAKEPVEVSCDTHSIDAAESCASSFLSASSQVSRAGECRDQSAADRSECSIFQMARYEVTITRTYGARANGGYSTVIEMKPAPVIPI